MKKQMLLLCLALMSMSMMGRTHVLSSVADFNALSAAQTDSVTFSCPLVALTQAGKYLLLTDGTDNALVYGYAQGINSTCQNGDTIIDLTALYCMYNNQLELKNARFTIGGHGPQIAPAEISAVSASNLLAYGKLSNVTASVANKKITFYTADGATVAGYNAASIALPDNPSSALTYEGFVMLSTSTYQFIPTAWTGEVEDIVYTPVASVAEFNALPDGSYFEFTTDVTVAFVYRIMYNCATIFQDQNGDGGQIYDIRHNTDDAYKANYEAGDIIPGGWKGIKIDYNGTKEITPLEGFAAPAGKGRVSYVERTFATLGETDVNRLVLVRNVQLVNTHEYSEKDQQKHRNATDGTVDVFDMYDTYHSNEANTGYVEFPEVDGTYDVMGVGANYKGTYEIHPISFDGRIPGFPESALENAEINAAQKLLIDGQVVIEKNGKLYNVLGVML